MIFKKTLTVVTTSLLLLLSINLEAQSQSFKIGKSIDVQMNVLNQINMLYVDSVNLDSLIIEATMFMLESLDPYTVLIPEEEKESLELLTTGSYGGIGAVIRKEGKNILISEVHENTPASKAGLNDGDLIIAIDGESVASLRVDECSAKMKGVAGTDVLFTVKNLRGGDTTDLKITREKVHFPDVLYAGMISDSVGYIRVAGFTIEAAKDVKKALVQLKKEPAMSRLILDLRGNGGGILDEAVEIVSLFVPKNTMVVSSKGKVKQVQVDYFTINEPVDTLIPLVVLVNSGSASSSEIVAGALQDLDRATIIGTRTFGKGLVQSIRDVGYNNKIKITTAKYYTPSGRCVQAIDYSQRNEDGSVGHIPDSLTRPFKTLLKGRTVYDGGGVTPDIKIESPYYSRPTLALVYGEIFHEYSILYFKDHISIASPAKFELTEQEYYHFVNWAVEKEFDHRTATEVEFDKFIAIAKRESLYDLMSKEAELLNKVVKMSKRDVLKTGMEEIKPL
ncbi:MAG: S41 family peptidase, partial [Bacteroidales bacterium]